MSFSNIDPRRHARTMEPGPVADAGECEPEPAARRTAAARRILAVDDNVDSVNSLAMLLRLMGHDVRTAIEGIEALDAARVFRPEIVVLDLGLPGMDGFEVA